MKLNNLKTGMIVKLRDGWRALVLIGCDFGDSSVNNCLVGEELDDYMPLSDYKEDMTYNNDVDYDIMFVYQPHHPYDVMATLRNVDTDRDVADCIYNREWEETNEKSSNL